MNDVNGLGPGFGGTLAAPIWHDYMSKASGGYCSDFPPPDQPVPRNRVLRQVRDHGGTGAGQRRTRGVQHLDHRRRRSDDEDDHHADDANTDDDPRRDTTTPLGPGTTTGTNTTGGAGATGGGTTTGGNNGKAHPPASAAAQAIATDCC